MAATNMTRRPTADMSADVEIIKYKDGAMGGIKGSDYNLYVHRSLVLKYMLFYAELHSYMYILLL